MQLTCVPVSSSVRCCEHGGIWDSSCLGQERVAEAATIRESGASVARVAGAGTKHQRGEDTIYLLTQGLVARTLKRDPEALHQGGIVKTL